MKEIERHLDDGGYDLIKLPVLDYPANNIPELSLGLRHLFKTPSTDNDDEKVIMYVRKDLLD